MTRDLRCGSIIRFGVFEADVRTRQLWKNGVRVRLQDQPFRVLRMLFERRGKVVTRSEIQRAIWPNTTFGDFDHALNSTIRRIRIALGDSAENPRFIETLPKRGYRFLFEVYGEAAPTKRPRWLAIAALAGAVALLAGVVAAMTVLPRVPPPTAAPAWDAFLLAPPISSLYPDAAPGTGLCLGGNRRAG